MSLLQGDKGERGDKGPAVSTIAVIHAKKNTCE